MKKTNILLYTKEGNLDYFRVKLDGKNRPYVIVGNRKLVLKTTELGVLFENGKPFFIKKISNKEKLENLIKLMSQDESE